MNSETVVQCFDTQVRRHPNALAIHADGREVSYTELDLLCNAVAHRLVRSGAPADFPVAVFSQYRVSTFAAILGALKAGRICVPLDPESPAARNAQILKDARPSVILTDGDYYAAARQFESSAVVIVDVDEEDIQDGRDPLPIAPRADDLAVIYYTSGSTGTPKGVAHQHQNLVHSVSTTSERLCITPHDRIALVHPMSSLSAGTCMLRALLNGAALLPFDVRRLGVAAYAAWIRAQRITLLQVVPTLFRHLLGVADAKRCLESIRGVWLGGETVTPNDVALAREHLPNAVLINNLGSTETLSCLQFQIDPETSFDDTTVPVGFAHRDKPVVLIGDNLMPVRRGEVGEIAVLGPHIGSGYWRDDALTERTFAPDPCGSGQRLCRTGDVGRERRDGSIELVGRKDNQVQIRGHRVALEEVEAQLNELPVVQSAAVTVATTAQGIAQLVAHVVPLAGGPPDAGSLRTALTPTLPDYMIPGAFLMRETLPVLPGGKVDRLSLSTRDSYHGNAQSNDDLSRDELTQSMVRIWQRVFALRAITPDDDFFELGGHSLLAVDIVEQIEAEHGLRLPLTALCAAPTAARLAAFARSTGLSSASVIRLSPGTGGRAVFFVPPRGGSALAFSSLVRLLPSTHAAYALEPVGAGGEHVPHHRLEDIAQHHVDAMRSVQPTGPYRLVGRCFGGVVAYEMAQQLRRHGESVALLALIDMVHAPGSAGKPKAGVVLRSVRQVMRAKRALQRRAYAALRRIRARLLYPHVIVRTTVSAPRSERMRALGALTAAHEQALRAYVADVYPGPLIMFQASSAGLGDRLLRSQWRQLAGGGVTCHEIDGNHTTLMRQPGVGVMARELARHIGAA